ncbi:MAG TPA: tetratricopeptide repeat protein, partial [Polyangiales bacterium]|nr:tetratricopeptide repeat protein [Polyangiales bacterium]
DATGVASAASTLAQQSTSARAELLQAASALLDQNEPQLAAHVLKAIAPAEGETRLRLRVLLECGKLDAAENLLATSTPSELGGLTATAEIYLALDRPASALELAQTALAQRPDDASARVIVGFAQLALGHAAEAATLFAGIPAASRSHEEAVLGLSQALRSQGLDALAREVARSGAERDQ